jgi:hypothetical protein
MADRATASMNDFDRLRLQTLAMRDPDNADRVVREFLAGNGKWTHDEMLLAVDTYPQLATKNRISPIIKAITTKYQTQYTSLPIPLKLDPLVKKQAVRLAQFAKAYANGDVSKVESDLAHSVIASANRIVGRRQFNQDVNEIREMASTWNRLMSNRN